jgi:DNA topoisomerase-1
MRNIKVDGLPVDIACPSCHKTGCVNIRYGRNGFFLSCSDCAYTTDFTRDEKGQPVPVAVIELKEEKFCQKCGKPMVVKRGRYGSFLACSGYPECRCTVPLKTNKDGEVEADDTPPPPLPEGFDPICPKCGGNMVPKKAKMGTWFIACDNYPKCKNAVSFPTGLKCPKIGCPGIIAEKVSKRGVFYGCSEYPKCRLILKGLPVKEPCPVCGHPYQVQSNRAASQGILTCPNPLCPTNPKSLEASSENAAAEPQKSRKTKVSELTSTAAPKKPTARKKTTVDSPSKTAEAAKPTLTRRRASAIKEKTN